MIHTASLVHDDVLDGSPLRRGEVGVSRIGLQTSGHCKGDICMQQNGLTIPR